MDPSLTDVLDNVERHLEHQDLYGWDPYDGLTSPLFRSPVLRSSHLLRFGAQQVIKRSPWNLRPLLRIAKQLNPVSVGLYAQGQSQRAMCDPLSRQARTLKVQRAVERLAAASSPGYSGSCWGYPFDWETRYGSLPAGTPTVVATGMIANGLFTAHRAFGITEAAMLLRSAAAFVMNDLNRTEFADGSFCWSYSPRDHHAVPNATLKGSRTLTQAYALTGIREWLDAAERSVRFTINHQQPSGAWPYSVGDRRSWTDHFHTGYVLECLSAYRRISGDTSVDAAIDRGLAYYRERLFTKSLVPKYYDDRVEPLDATACAQAIITLSEFGDIDAATTVAKHACAALAQTDGSFAFQRRRGRTIRTPFLRWSTAWMYCALSRHAQASQQAAAKGLDDPSRLVSAGDGRELATAATEWDVLNS